MSYLVLARKYRPSTFDEVVGQNHITDILKQAISSKRVAHAYLFCGPRGIGKTSCARILAKCLNCEDGPKVTPPKTSAICKEIDAGTSFDVLEIDGASNRGIDEVRTLRENVKFAPSYGRYKIYIVDEVHMLTQEAFNALLKTLEEPPAHVKFIFATTDINKVPSTILSRCQRFDFKRIPLKTITESLQHVCKKEKLKIDEDALIAIAKAAQGSLRDGLSILDQLSAINDRDIKADDVFSMLGIVEMQLLFELADALSEKNCAETLAIFDKIIEKGKDVKQLNKDLIEHFRNLMVIKVGGKSLGRLVDYPVAIKEMYLTQSANFTLKEILESIECFISAQDTARITESLRIPLEVAFAKLTYQAEPARKVVTSDVELPKKTILRKTPVEVLKNQKGQADFIPADSEPDEEEVLDESIQEVDEIADVAGTLTLDKIKNSWDALTFAVSRQKMSVATYLQEGVPISFGTPKLTIGFPKEAVFQKESLEEKDNKRLIEKVFADKLKTKIIVDFKLVDEVIHKEAEGVVKTALETFKGKVVSKWHNE